MRALTTAAEFPFPEDVVRVQMGVSWTTWRKYKAAGKVRTVELFSRQYISSEEYRRLLIEGTGHNRRPGRKPMEAAE